MMQKWIMRRMARTAAALLCAFLVTGLACAQSRTYTKISPVSKDAAGHASVTVNVTDDTGQPVTGAVSLVDITGSATHWLSGAALDAQGQATFRVDNLAAGDHALHAEFVGTSSDTPSTSQPLTLHTEAAAIPDFTIALAPSTFTVKTGGTAATTITITPLNGFTGFISLSCSGLPIDYVTCNNTPANLEITSATPQTAVMNIQTTATSSTTAGWLQKPAMPGAPLARGNGAYLALLPGFVGLGWLTRKRRKLMRSTMLLLLASVALIGATGCSAQYWYYHLGPIFGGTPPGTYTITVTAQTSNGVTAAEHSASVALTVQ